VNKVGQDATRSRLRSGPQYANSRLGPHRRSGRYAIKWTCI